MNFDDLKFTLDDGKEYLVVDSVIYKECVYVYLVNYKNPLDSMYKLVRNFDNDFVLEDVDPILFKNEILELFAKD